MGTQQYCSFRLAGHLFGVEVDRVQEVLRHQEMSRVPLSWSVVEGLINLRGQIVTAIDLRRRLGLPSRPEGELPLNVVVRTDDGPLSLLVDEIGDVIDVDDSAFEPPPPTLEGIGAEFVRGAQKLEGGLLLVLDTPRVVAPPAAAGDR